MECPHQNQDTLEDGSTLICVDCGIVLDEYVLSSLDHTGPTFKNLPPPGPRPLIATKIHQKSYSKQAIDRLGRFLSEMSGHFGYTIDNQQIMALFDEIVQQGICDYGRSGERAIAALFLLFGRKGGLPISLRRVCEFLTDEGVGRMVLSVLERHPELASPNRADRFLARHLSLIAINQDTLKLVRRSFTNLCDYLTGCGFHEGRSPEPFSLSVLVVVLEAYGADVDMPQLCDTLQLSYKTVYKRYTEIKKHLLSRAKDLLPWGSEIKNSTVLEYFDDLLPILNVQSAPPAFVRSIANSKERVELISQVRQGHSNNTLEAFIVEYLLESGWTEAEICSLSRLTIDQLDQGR